MDRLRIASVIGLLVSPVAALVGWRWYVTPFCVSAERITYCNTPTIVYYGLFVFSLSMVAFMASLSVLVLTIGRKPHVVNRKGV